MTALSSDALGCNAWGGLTATPVVAWASPPVAALASCPSFDNAVHAAEIALRDGARFEQDFAKQQESQEACSRAASELQGFESLQVRASDSFAHSCQAERKEFR